MRRAPLRAWLAGGVLALGACAPPAGPATVPAADAAPPAPVATDGPAPPPVATAVSSTDASGTTPWQPGVVEAPPEGIEPWGVWIPRIGVSADLVRLGLDARGELEVPERPEAAGWYVDGPRPGEVGPAVVAGHVDSRTGPAVFARLHELRAGDLAHLVYRDGFVVTYRIAGVQRFGKDEFPTTAVYGDTDTPVLRLITCGGSFDRRAGSYRDNVIAHGEVLGTWAYDPAAA